MKNIFSPDHVRIPEKTDEGWVVSSLGSGYLFLLAPVFIIIAILPWYLLMVAASIWALLLGGLIAGFLTYEYVNMGIMLFWSHRVILNRSYLTAVRLGKKARYPLGDIRKISTKYGRFVTVYFRDGGRVRFHGAPGYNCCDAKTCFARILEIYGNGVEADK